LDQVYPSGLFEGGEAERLGGLKDGERHYGASPRVAAAVAAESPVVVSSDDAVSSDDIEVLAGDRV
jgi:hypothetical protein